jgi:hypothetical protein
MNTLDKRDSRTGIFSLFKGPSGSGKTVAALSFPNPYLVDLDRKMPAIADKHFPGKSIEYDVFPDIFELSSKISSWVNGDCPYETVIYDSLTSLVSLIFKSIGEAKGEGTIQMLNTLKATRTGGKMVELLGIDYYNAETRFFDWIIDANKVLYSRQGNPKNIIFTAHILTTESAPDLKTKIVTRTRSIVTAGRKVAAYVPTQFDEVYLFGTSEVGGLDGRDSHVRHMMTSETSGEDDAKTAFKISKMTDFTNKSLYDQLQSQLAGEALFL